MSEPVATPGEETHPPAPERRGRGTTHERAEARS